jgi:hypothetical protein
MNLLSQLIFVIEVALATVTMGDHLWTILNRLEELTKQHRNRIAYERESAIRQENSNLFVLDDLNISVAGQFSFDGNRFLESSIINQVIRVLHCYKVRFI